MDRRELGEIVVVLGGAVGIATVVGAAWLVVQGVGWHRSHSYAPHSYDAAFHQWVFLSWVLALVCAVIGGTGVAAALWRWGVALMSSPEPPAKPPSAE